MTEIRFGREITGDLGSASEHEWLVTDGTGGYAMGTIGGYILGKLPLYRRALSGNAVDQWIRTGREKSEPRFPNDSRFS